jgi:UDP-N-acetylglucosamine acyltransferase
MTAIHPTAIIEPGAKLGEGVKIGPFCTVGPDVVLGDGVELVSHVVVAGRTSIGAGTKVWPFASLGTDPQDLKFHGEPGRLEIGARNRIREHATMNIGTEHGGMLTRVGDDCLFMIATHVAHDCQIGNGVILANNATLAGHVVVGDSAIVGGLSAVRQFIRIGHNAMIGGMSGVENDVIPYGLVMGERAGLAGLNLVGLQRSGMPKERIRAMRDAFELLFESGGSLAERAERTAETFAAEPAVGEILAFIEARGRFGICQPSRAAEKEG